MLRVRLRCGGENRTTPYAIGVSVRVYVFFACLHTNGDAPAAE